MSKLGFGSSEAEANHRVAVSPVDVVVMLALLAEVIPEKPNWNTSNVDLLKRLGMESSLAERKELATELGCPAEKRETPHR